MTTFSQDEVEAHLANLAEWSETGGAIQRTYQFDDFVQAIAFVDKIAVFAETAQHHPDILIRYNKVSLTLSTHDAGGITEKDFNLASEIDEAF